MPIQELAWIITKLMHVERTAALCLVATYIAHITAVPCYDVKGCFREGRGKGGTGVGYVYFMSIFHVQKHQLSALLLNITVDVSKEGHCLPWISREVAVTHKLRTQNWVDNLNWDLEVILKFQVWSSKCFCWRNLLLSTNFLRSQLLLCLRRSTLQGSCFQPQQPM